MGTLDSLGHLETRVHLAYNFGMIKPPRSWNSRKHLTSVLSSEWYQTLGKIQSEVVKISIEFFFKNRFDFLLLPITTGSVSSPVGLGSDSLPVKVSIGGIDSYLADSMQFYLELACRVNKTNTFYIAPSFRGEEADRRHLSQFFHIEAEFSGNLDNSMALVEDYLQFLTRKLYRSFKKEITRLSGTTDHIDFFLSLGEKRLPRCTFDEACKILEVIATSNLVTKNNGFRVLTSDGERKLMEHFGGFVWITNYDHISVPFYQKFADKEMKTASNADLLMGIGETVGLGERHSTGNEIRKALKLHKVSARSYAWYIQMKDLVNLPTSGFGMGVERYLLWLFKHDDIRDMQLVPRFNGVKDVL